MLYLLLITSFYELDSSFVDSTLGVFVVLFQYPHQLLLGVAKICFHFETVCPNDLLVIYAGSLDLRRNLTKELFLLVGKYLNL